MPAAGRVMFHRRMLSDLVLLRTLPGHACVATSALGAVGSAVATHARAAEIRAIVVSGLLVTVVVVVAVGRRDTGAVHSRVGILDSVVSANQAMVSVVSAIGHLLTGIFIIVPAAVRPEISIRVIGAVWAIVRVIAGLVATVGVEGAVVTIPSMIL